MIRATACVDYYDSKAKDAVQDLHGQVHSCCKKVAKRVAINGRKYGPSLIAFKIFRD